MAVEIVSSPMENGDFPVRYVSLPEGRVLFIDDMNQDRRTKASQYVKTI